MAFKIFHRVFPLVAVAMITLLSGCLVRTEEITIAPDGTTTILAEIRGESDDFDQLLAMPSEPEWTVLQEPDLTAKSYDGKDRLRARVEVPYGRSLPHSYAAPGSEKERFDLQFPTEVRRWTEGKRTYYEFRRTYKARRYGCYNISATPFWDHELEERVIEKGIFEVSQQDRRVYLEAYSQSLAYLQWRMFWQGLGALVHDGLLPGDTKAILEKEAMAYVEEAVTEERILGILSRDEAAIAQAVDSFINEVQDNLAMLYHRSVDTTDVGLLQAYTDAMWAVNHNYSVTEALTGQKLGIMLRMPGTIIDANGIIEEDDGMLVVHWFLRGSDFNDTDVPLYALSVVEV